MKILLDSHSNLIKLKRGDLMKSKNLTITGIW